MRGSFFWVFVITIVCASFSANATSVISFSNRSEAISAANGSYDTVITGGYYQAGDGGGAVYNKEVTDTTSATGDLGGFRDAGGIWWGLSAQVMNVRQFGAKGDGNADDADAINTAITTAASKGSGKVYLPSGIYVVKKTISMLPGTYLMGDGQGLSERVSVPGTQIRAGADLTSIVQTKLNSVEGPYSIENLLINGNLLGGAKVEVGLKLKGNDVRLTNVAVWYVDGTGLRLLSAGTPDYNGGKKYNYIIADCDIKRNNIGIRNESAGALFYMNDIENNDYSFDPTADPPQAPVSSVVQDALGGNVWLGNHFQSKNWWDTEIFKVRVPEEYESAVRREVFIGNSFQKAKTGMRVVSIGPNNKYSANMVIKDNWFGMTDADIIFQRVKDISVVDTQILGMRDARHDDTPTIAPQRGIVFSDVTNGILDGIHGTEDLLGLVDQLPSSVSLVNSSLKIGHKDPQYNFVEQNKPSANKCVKDGVLLTSGASRTFYSKLFAFGSQSCADAALVRTCSDGELSGSRIFQYSSCTEVPEIQSETPYVDTTIYDVMPVTFSNRALAKKATNITQQLIKTEGYSEAGDGGGAVYVKVSDNSVGTRGGFCDASDQCWELMGWPLNVRWFGAKGDGQADDTVAINKTIEAASKQIKRIVGVAGGSGGAVYIPQGVYSVSAPIQLNQGTLLFGKTRTNSKLFARADLSVMLQTENLAEISQPNTIMSLGLDGDRQNGKSVGAGIHVFGRTVKILDVQVDNVSGTGIRMEGTAYYDNGDDRDPAWVNTVANSRVTNSQIGFWTGSSDSFYWQNDFIDNDSNEAELRGDAKWFANRFVGGDIGLKSKFRVLSTYYDRSTDQIIANRFEDNNIGLLVTNGNAVDAKGNEIIPDSCYLIDGNTFNNVKKVGIKFYHYNHVTVSGSRFFTNSSPPTEAVMSFSGVFFGLIKNLTTIGTFQNLFDGIPSSVSVIED